MKKSLSLLLVALLGSFVSLAVPQTPASHRFPTPPEGQNHEGSDQPQVLPARRIDFTQVQKEADDLARAADSIPSDVASVRQGTLPKDMLAKLKEIEKLSKHLRSELNP